MTVRAAALRGLLIAGALTVLAVLGTGPAAAHSVLLHMTPPAASALSNAPPSVSLTFNEQPRGQYSTIHVTGPDGQRRDDGQVQVVNDVITERLAGSRPAGRYVVDWRVVSADGHPVSGQFTFTAKNAAAQVVARPAQAAPTSAAASGGSTGSSSSIVFGAVVAVLVVLGLVVGFILRRRGPAVHE